ncbi:copper homeostasis protein CutC [Flavobacterium jejuense]|uniref:PF03932 family protein CutC n=1 Tax=Flavobacterium jejuense TaxID=1544455 RepID=A0ABX0J073_9FLAO|nr:copper homeostasis protein CutC [Flavobacterium jejuense]NHN27626.1 copper homeostasis protein CutC [Flavobacterium jejuense]
MAKLEIACFNLESALIAQENGADRVELCAKMHLGGTTPSLEIIKQARKQLSIDLFVMIRPRGGNFVYTMNELMMMYIEILELKDIGVDGFVFGVLTNGNKIDIEVNKSLVELAKPFPCTFHRAFDEVQNPLEALEELIECGFQTILTSGNATNVNEGISQLDLLVQKANKRITIMPGGSLRSSNLKMIEQKTKAIFFHSSAIIDDSKIANPIEIQKLKAILNA